MSANKAKTYIVWRGRRPGIYHTWKECEREVKGYPARFKSFEGITQEEAREIYLAGPENEAAGYGRKKEKNPSPPPADKKTKPEIPPLAWAVDAATSHNPGPMEYRCVEIDTGEIVFASKVYPLGTNNIGEFLAIVHALALMQKQGFRRPLYSDSRNAINWVRHKTCRTTLPHSPLTEELYAVIDRALNFLRHTDLTAFDLRKWPTELLGEIPADYGRK